MNKRLNGTEKCLYEKIFKLVSEEESSILEILTLRIYMNHGTDKADEFLMKIDELGLYDKKMCFLHRACLNFPKTFYAVQILFDRLSAGKITRNEIISLETQHQFEELIRTMYTEIASAIINDPANILAANSTNIMPGDF